jgi:hypothetical protein
MTPDNYFRTILADGARPFRHRAGVCELLGRPDDSGVRVSFGTTRPGPGFPYLRHSPASAAEYLPGAALSSDADWWSQIEASTVDGGSVPDRGFAEPAPEPGPVPAVVIPGVTARPVGHRSDGATPGPSSTWTERVVDRTQPGHEDGAAKSEPDAGPVHALSDRPAQPAETNRSPHWRPVLATVARALPAGADTHQISAPYPRLAGRTTSAEVDRIDDGQPAERPAPAPAPVVARPTITPAAAVARPTTTPIAAVARPTVTPIAVTARSTVAPAGRTPDRRIPSVGAGLADAQAEVPRPSLPARRRPAARPPADDMRAGFESPGEWTAARQSPPPAEAPRLVVVRQAVVEPGVAAFWERRHLGRLGRRGGVLR